MMNQCDSMHIPLKKNNCSARGCPRIFIFVALDCEARPLIKFYNLKKENLIHSFTIYRNNEIVLTVSGVGKNIMAAAVAYTLASFPDCQHPVLINIGIAGHKTQETGKLYLAMKIVDEESGKKFYPSMVLSKIPETSIVQTVSRPCDIYTEDCLFDMEASAFYETGIRFSSCELIQCIKIVSDNQESGLENIHPKLVSQWLTNQLNKIDMLIKSLSKLQESIAVVTLAEYQEIIENYHFTVSGKLKLKALLMRWKILSSDLNLSLNVEDFYSGKELLRQLEREINGLKIHL